MPVDLFLKLAGIDGESTDARHRGEIEVLGWSWGQSQEAPSASSGAGAGAGKVKHLDLTIQKRVDVATPLLLSACAQGRHISDGTLTTRSTNGQEFLLFTMTNVFVTSVNMSEASKDDPRPSETVTLNFTKLDFDYRMFKPDGSVGAEKSFKWDFATNTSL
jgi:type VI secretion system secreted protein Hcp